MLRLPDPGEQYDAADPEAEKKAKAAADLREDRMRKVEAALLSTPQGREWVWGVLNDCRIWEKRIAMSGEHENGFFEGEREIGLRLMRRLARSAPDSFARMIAEQDRGHV